MIACATARYDIPLWTRKASEFLALGWYSSVVTSRREPEKTTIHSAGAQRLGEGTRCCSTVPVSVSKRPRHEWRQRTGKLTRVDCIEVSASCGIVP